MLKLARLAAYSARNSSAAIPSSTNRPTMISMVLVRMGHQVRDRHGVENINAVRMKSMPSTPSEAITTERVVAADTPAGVASAS